MEKVHPILIHKFQTLKNILDQEVELMKTLTTNSTSSTNEAQLITLNTFQGLKAKYERILDIETFVSKTKDYKPSPHTEVFSDINKILEMLKKLCQTTIQQLQVPLLS
jgi:hypothetical protein